jgi:hypothetical protein
MIGREQSGESQPTMTVVPFPTAMSTGWKCGTFPRPVQVLPNGPALGDVVGNATVGAAVGAAVGEVVREAVATGDVDGLGAVAAEAVGSIEAEGSG